MPSDIGLLVGGLAAAGAGLYCVWLGYQIKFKRRINLIAGITQLQARGTMNLLAEERELSPELEAAAHSFGLGTMSIGCIIVVTGVIVAGVGYSDPWFWGVMALVTLIAVGSVLASRRVPPA